MVRMHYFVAAAWLAMACAYKEVYPPVDSNATTTPLYLALMMSFGGGFNSSGTIPAIKVALDTVNADPSMLPGYTLHYTLLDTQCDHTLALETFFQQIFVDPVKLGILGAGCSPATEPTADISHFYNLTQVSCASASPTLADRTRFKNYFQVIPTDLEMAPIFPALCRQYGWRHISIAQQDVSVFIETVAKVTNLLDLHGITYQRLHFETDDGVRPFLDQIYENEARIIYLAMYSNNARIAICNAYNTGRKYPKYLYITYAWYIEDWYISDDINCTASQMEEMLNSSLLVTPYPEIEDKDMITDEGVTHNAYVEKFLARQQAEGYIFNQEHDQCFDTLWSIAFALNSTITELTNNMTFNKIAGSYGADKTGTTGANGTDQNDFRIEQFTYDNSAVVGVMRDRLVHTDFLGVTGPVMFDEEGIRSVIRLRVLQYRNQETGILRQEIASVDVTEDNLTFTYAPGESNGTVFSMGIPYDGVAENVTVSVHPAVTTIFGLVSVFGIAFAVVCVVFNLVNHDKPTIRLTSPNLNYIILLGVVVIDISVFFYILPAYSMDAQTAFCNLGPRLFALGYSFCFGTILAKMWRVYVIFTNPSAKSKSVKDWHLMLFVLAFLVVDVVILGILSAYVGGRVEAVLVPNKERPTYEDQDNQLISEYTYICESRDRDIWLGIVFGYKALLQIVAIFLAFGTHKVKIKGLDDYKYIAMAIYVTSLVLVLLIISNVTLNDYINFYASLHAVCLLSISIIITALVFLPKMYLLYKDPEGKTIFERSSSASTVNGLTNLGTKVEQERLKKRIEELEQLLSNNGIPIPQKHNSRLSKFSMTVLAKLSSSLSETKKEQAVPSNPSRFSTNQMALTEDSLRQDCSVQNENSVKIDIPTEETTET